MRVTKSRTQEMREETLPRGHAPRPPAQAALAARTRRYASYQRKWMRRVPGIVMVDGDRPVGEIADDIVSLARTRERLPRL